MRLLRMLALETLLLNQSPADAGIATNRKTKIVLIATALLITSPLMIDLIVAQHLNPLRWSYICLERLQQISLPVKSVC